MHNEEELQGESKNLLPLDGICYSTRHGLFDCEVIEDKNGGPRPGGVKLEVRLTRRPTGREPTPTVRRLIIQATRKVVEEKRLSLTFEVHRWALSEPTSPEYLESVRNL